jgi:hypothetical protein
MKIPKSVKIGGFRYTVEITDNLTLGRDYSGEITHNDLMIRLRPLAQQMTELALVHECVHGLLDMMLDEQFGESKPDRGERFVVKFSAALYALIEDNPEMFDSGLSKKRADEILDSVDERRKLNGRKSTKTPVDSDI